MGVASPRAPRSFRFGLFVAAASGRVQGGKCDGPPADSSILKQHTSSTVFTATRDPSVNSSIMHALIDAEDGGSSYPDVLVWVVRMVVHMIVHIMLTTPMITTMTAWQQSYSECYYNGSDDDANHDFQHYDDTHMESCC